MGTEFHGKLAFGENDMLDWMGSVGSTLGPMTRLVSAPSVIVRGKIIDIVFFFFFSYSQARQLIHSQSRVAEQGEERCREILVTVKYRGRNQTAQFRAYKSIKKCKHVSSI